MTLHVQPVAQQCGIENNLGGGSACHSRTIIFANQHLGMSMGHKINEDKGGSMIHTVAYQKGATWTD